MLKNLTFCILEGQIRTHTRQRTGFAGFGLTSQFQSAVPVFGLFFLWSHSDILMLMANIDIGISLFFSDVLATFRIKTQRETLSGPSRK